MTSRYLLLVTAALGLAACSTAYPDVDNGQYWQRISTAEAIYQQGPKAQQMLNRDIGRCVIEIRELERLGSLKNAISTDENGRVLDPDEKALSDWDTPERDGRLMAEHGNYQDFETCMLEKGWERVKYVPFEVARRAEQNFFRAHVNYKGDPRHPSTEYTPPASVSNERQAGPGRLND